MLQIRHLQFVRPEAIHATLTCHIGVFKLR